MFVYHIDERTKVYVLQNHLQSFHAREQQRVMGGQSLTGREIVEMARLTVQIGMVNSFNWRTGVVTLTDRVANGTDEYARLTAHHEVAHSMQPEWVLAAASAWYGAQTSGAVAKMAALPLWPAYAWSEYNAWQTVVGSDG